MFAIWGHNDAAKLAYYGIHSLQHRGQEGVGIVVTDGEKMKIHKGPGLLNETFQPSDLEELEGHAAIAHARYSTALDGKGIANVQPLLFRSQKGGLAIAHNGSLVNARQLRYQLESQGSIFQSSTDAEIFAHLIKRSGFQTLEEQLINALSMVKGAYALMVMDENQLLVALDPTGIRPLSIGRFGEAYVVASETCAFDIIGATFERDVEPGELIIIDKDGMRSRQIAKASAREICSMEYIYFARPDSNLAGINVHTARKNLGKQLAIEAPVEADVVTGVPDSSISAAIGYAEQSGIPYELGLIKNRYIGRTFIQPSQSLRDQGVKMKLSAVRGVVDGKRVVIIDDSIVRGTTSKRIVHMLREAGAKEVHVRISSPTIQYPCYYGIDMLTKEELIAANYSIEEIKDIIGADSLQFLSVEGLLKGIGLFKEGTKCGQCRACFTGNYPTEIYPDFNGI